MFLTANDVHSSFKQRYITTGRLNELNKMEYFQLRVALACNCCKYDYICCFKATEITIHGHKLRFHVFLNIHHCDKFTNTDCTFSDIYIYDIALIFVWYIVFW
jgi:hypothetical protein